MPRRTLRVLGVTNRTRLRKMGSIPLVTKKSAREIKATGVIRSDKKYAGKKIFPPKLSPLQVGWASQKDGVAGCDLHLKTRDSPISMKICHPVAHNTKTRNERST